MIVLNLYAGLGGNRKHWKNVEVTAVEKSEDIAEVYQQQHPNDEIIVGDAHAYLQEHYSEFDFIWSSPPCQTHSKMHKANCRTKKQYPDLNLYQEIIFLQHFFKGKWVVENVVPYYEPLIPCTKVGRHMFWSNFNIEGIPDVARPKGFINRQNLEAKKMLMDWLGIHYEKNIYYENNHCPTQILRNCVHPDIGLSVFNKAMLR